MWSHCLLVLICLKQFVSGLEIVDHPPDLLWVKQSESTEFVCKSNQPWQWCYWELIPIEGLVDQPAKTRKFQTHQGGATYINPSMKFFLNESVCGLEITSADYELHNGQWKCHLADTDQKESIKSEAFVQLQVSVESPPTLTATIPEKGISLNYADSQLLGTLLTVSCSTQLTKSNPFPSFNLWLVKDDGASKQLLASSQQPISAAKIENFELTKADQGKYFMCESTQASSVDPVGPPQTIFNNFVTGEPLQLVYPPMLDVISQPPYLFHNESLMIQIPFSSRPVPQEDQIAWTIQPLYPLDQNNTMQTIIDSDNEETDLFRGYPIKSSDTKDEYLASLEVLNLTESVQVTLSVWNSFGEMKHVFAVHFVAPLPNPGGSVDVTVSEAGFPLWLIILLGIGGIVLILLVLLICFCCKGKNKKKKEVENFSSNQNIKEIQSDSWSRKKPGDVGSTPMTSHVIKEKKSGKKVQHVDLDKIPDHELPLLEKIYSDATGATPFLHRSMSDETSTENESLDVVDSRPYPIPSARQIPIQTEIKLQSADPHPIPSVRQIQDPITEEKNHSKTKEETDSDFEEEDFFNEKLLDIQNTDPDILGSMEDLDPELVVIRQHDIPKVVENPNFFRNSGQNQIVMTTGPTSYPVVTSPTARVSYFPSPSYIPGRRTTQIDFLQQSEQQQQQLQQQQQQPQSGSLNRYERTGTGTFGRR